MRYYNILYSIYHYYTNIKILSILLFFILIIIILYWCILGILREIQYNFSLLCFKSTYKRFEYKDRNEFINVSLFYKLYSVPLTIIESTFYFILVICSILTFRIIRLAWLKKTYDDKIKKYNSLDEKGKNNYNVICENQYKNSVEKEKIKYNREKLYSKERQLLNAKDSLEEYKRNQAKFEISKNKYDKLLSKKTNI